MQGGVDGLGDVERVKEEEEEFVCIDEDADVDESGDCDMGDSARHSAVCTLVLN